MQLRLRLTFACRCPITLHHLFKRLHFLHWVVCSPLSKTSGHIYVDLFLVSVFCSIDFFKKIKLFILLYNIILVLLYNDLNPPWYTCVPHPEPPSHLLPHPSHPSGSSQCTSLKHLYHASNLDWRFVSHMIINMFQCHSPISSHPCPLPQSPKDLIHLCLFCCLAYRVIVTSF